MRFTPTMAAAWASLVFTLLSLTRLWRHVPWLSWMLDGLSSVQRCSLAVEARKRNDKQNKGAGALLSLFLIFILTKIKRLTRNETSNDTPATNANVRETFLRTQINQAPWTHHIPHTVNTDSFLECRHCFKTKSILLQATILLIAQQRSHASFKRFFNIFIFRLFINSLIQCINWSCHLRHFHPTTRTLDVHLHLRLCILNVF